MMLKPETRHRRRERQLENWRTEMFEVRRFQCLFSTKLQLF